MRALLRTTLCVAVASAAFLAPRTPNAVGAPSHQRCARAAFPVAAVAEPTDTADALLGRVVSVSEDGLIAIDPEDRELAKVGVLLQFGGGGTGVILSERCGLYFATTLDGKRPGSDESATMLPRNLTVPAVSDDASWGGVFDYLGRKAGEAAAERADTDRDVFSEPVTAARRRPIGASLHTGVVAIDALAPIGRGQSMMLFGPDSLPAGSRRTDIALRIVRAQRELQSGVRSVLVLAEPDAAAREAAKQTLREANVLESVRVLEATTPVEALIASSAACAYAEACGSDDVLVVIDSLRPQLQLWKSICKLLSVAKVPVSPEEEGSQQRQYYARLVERAARRKEDADGGGSVTLLLLQPSVSVLPAANSLKEEYEAADFAEFTQTVRQRVAMLEGKGVKLTQDVLVKVGIPLPGSDHPATGKGQRSQQHLEELTSLVDGHIDLRENLAQAGRMPPIDPSNSLTRIGVGSTKLRPLATTAAMASVNTAMRLNLAAASDGCNFDAREKARAAAYYAALQQPSPTPLSLGEEVCLLYAASLGALDAPVAAAGADGCAALLDALLAHVQSKDPELLPKISESGLLGENQQAKLGQLIAEGLA